jgi:hypothetical protein
MSGGYWDYSQMRLRDMADSLEAAKTEPTLREHRITHELERCINHLRLAEIYMQRLDWLVSGDDSQRDFIKRLREDLDEYFEEAPRAK